MTRSRSCSTGSMPRATALTPSGSHRRPSAKPTAPEEFDEEETSPKASMGDTKPYTSPSKPQITEDGIPDVDLSAIRQQISEEVQRIYEDDQNS